MAADLGICAVTSPRCTWATDLAPQRPTPSSSFPSATAEPTVKGGHPRTPKGRAFPSHSSICDLGQQAEERGNLNLYVGPGLLWEFYENEGLETTYLT